MAEDENGQIRKHVEILTASEVLWDVRCEGSCGSAGLKHLRKGRRQVEKVCLHPAFPLFGNFFPVLLWWCIILKRGNFLYTQASSRVVGQVT